MNVPLLPELARIPAGRLIQGIPQCPPRAGFAWIWHSGKSIDLPSFQLARHQVTNAEYQMFIRDAGYSAPSHLERPEFNADRQPVIGISWHDAVAYCEWLAQRTGRPFRLPTDAEWEYAAHGDQPGAIFPWGNALDPQFACFGGQAAPRPVGSFPANQFGLYDMIGNAWEWCSDRFEDVSDGVKAINKPTGKDPAQNRVVRGGSYMTTHYLNLWVPYRHEDPPDLRHESIGFRLALS